MNARLSAMRTAAPPASVPAALRWPRRCDMGPATITWWGHACVEVATPGAKTILFDPWFGNPRSPRGQEAVSRCDLMLVTHGHGDHFGDALPIASRTRPAWPGIP